MRQLRYFGTRKATAEIQPAPAADVVGIGSRVAYRLNGTERHVTIVGHDEAEPAAHRIAFTAPLGRALMGAEAGEMVAFQGREDALDRKSVVWGKGVSVGVDLGGSGIFKKKIARLVRPLSNGNSIQQITNK